MMDILKQWIVNLCGVVILVTAVEMILPDNSLKKYAKYVLGLVIVLVMMSPLLKLYNKGFDAEVYMSKSEAYFDKEVYRKEVDINVRGNEEKTIQLFKENLSKQCVNVLNNTYKKDKFHINVEVVKKENVLYVSKINIEVNDGGVKTVKPITIGKNDETQYKPLEDKEKEKKIKTLLFDYLGINEDKIYVYKMG